MLFYAKIPDALAFIFIPSGIYMRCFFSAVSLYAYNSVVEGRHSCIYDHYDWLFYGNDSFAGNKPLLFTGVID
jgi:hypothetical protein